MSLFIDILRIIGIVVWLVVFWALTDPALWSPTTAKILIIAGIALNLFVMVLERRRRDYY